MAPLFVSWVEAWSTQMVGENFLVLTQRNRTRTKILFFFDLHLILGEKLD